MKLINELTQESIKSTNIQLRLMNYEFTLRVKMLDELKKQTRDMRSEKWKIEAGDWFDALLARYDNDHDVAFN